MPFSDAPPKLPSLIVDHDRPMSSPLSSPPSAESATRIKKKKSFGSSALCGLRCGFSDDSAVVSPENCEEKLHVRRKRKKIEKFVRAKTSSLISSVARDESARSDCSEKPYSGGRNVNHELRYSVEDPFPSFHATLLGSDPTPSWRYHQLRGYYHHRPAEIEQIMNFHRRIGSGLRDSYDRHSDWRLDVDNMTYEDLLELGDKIGYVSTGLREEEIASSIIKLKPSNFDIRISSEKERKCSVCQEEYEISDEVGKIGCGHSFHIECIKKWLLQKNACPVCKAAVIKT